MSVDVGSLEELIRHRVRETIEAVVAAELAAALGAARSDRVGEARDSIAGFLKGHGGAS